MKFLQDFNDYEFNLLLDAIVNNKSIKFKNEVYNHIMYLKKNNKYKFYVKDNSLGVCLDYCILDIKFYPLKRDNYTLYRAIGFKKMLDVLKNKEVGNYYFDKNDFRFNKTFLGSNFDRCVELAKMTNTGDLIFVLEINTQDLQLYHFLSYYVKNIWDNAPDMSELFVHEDINVKYIKNIYMVDNKFRVTEIGNIF